MSLSLSIIITHPITEYRKGKICKEAVAEREADLLFQHLAEGQGKISRKPRIFCSLR